MQHLLQTECLPGISFILTHPNFFSFSLIQFVKEKAGKIRSAGHTMPARF
jgi:hypothetical protein